MLYASTLLNLRVFDRPSQTEEDAQRTGMYTVERQRRDSRNQIQSLAQWLKGLEIKVTAQELNPANLMRAAQLFNKTNQMNLKTRRMSETELMGWSKEQGHKLWVMDVADKFGRYGLTGLVSVSSDERKAVVELVDFLLSCRVMGRHVEETMLYIALNYAKDLKAKEVIVEYLPTEKNKPCLEFFQQSGFLSNGTPNLFRWQTEKDYSLPDAIELKKG